MSCSSCTKGFSLFTREHGCPSCGFSFCSSCLKHSTTIKDNKGPKQEKVCSSCYKKLQNPAQPKQVQPPPEALQKRLEKTPLPPPLTQADQKHPRRGLLGPEDQKIADRLSALHKERQEMVNLPSEEEVRDRLDKLKGVSTTPTVPAHYQPPVTRSNLQRTDELFSAVSAEVQLEARLPVLSPDQEIAARLARLRGEAAPAVSQVDTPATNLTDPSSFLQSGGGGVSTSDLEKMNMDEVAKLIETVDKDVQLEARAALSELKKDRAIQEQLERLRVKPSKTKEPIADNKSESSDSDSEDRVLAQILAEVKLEDRLSPLAPEFSSLEPPEPKELPWCVICNADAVFRCKGCDGDLYCSECFREGHRGEDLREHSKLTFKK
eukprot:GFUD01020660.1.p1 GENE.GFUD01020660.1~~GFUD01020660.1.p1  ORF type:complete len:379 (-),score=124.09 GFUD01020660.1:577-1713(-)